MNDLDSIASKSDKKSRKIMCGNYNQEKSKVEIELKKERKLQVSF